VPHAPSAQRYVAILLCKLYLRSGHLVETLSLGVERAAS
jgi:hypothetical protein